MATEADVEQLFNSLLPRMEEIKGRDAGLRTAGNLGCLLMLLPFGGAIALIPAFDTPRIAEALRGWPLVAAPFLGAFVFYFGFRLWRPWSNVNSSQRAEADEALLQPLAALVLPGATFTRPAVMLSRIHPSLLLSIPRGATSTSCAHIEGRLLGRPVQIDEMASHFDADMPACWIVRVELPFALAGHVRIRKPTLLGAARFWSDGFEPLDDAARLGNGWVVDEAPLGAGTPEGVAEPPPGAVPPGVVLTDGLFDVLRSREDIRVAVTGRELWIVVVRAIQAFESQVPGYSDLSRWKNAVPALQDVEAVMREVLSAGRR